MFVMTNCASISLMNVSKSLRLSSTVTDRMKSNNSSPDLRIRNTYCEAPWMLKRRAMSSRDDVQPVGPQLGARVLLGARAMFWTFIFRSIQITKFCPFFLFFFKSVTAPLIIASTCTYRIPILYLVKREVLYVRYSGSRVG